VAWRFESTATLVSLIIRGQVFRRSLGPLARRGALVLGWGFQTPGACYQVAACCSLMLGGFWSFLIFGWRVCILVSRVWGVCRVSNPCNISSTLMKWRAVLLRCSRKKNKSNMYHIHEQLTLECNDLFVLQFFIRLTWTTCSDTWIGAVANSSVANFSGTQNIWYGSLLINVEEMTSGRKFRCPPYSFRH